jgi:hypothetical protein
MKGDDFLSSFELQMWSLIQHVLIKWHTLVLFQWTRYSVPDKSPSYIRFFVPKSATYCFEICRFLEHELEKERKPKTVLSDVTIPETFVQIFPTEMFEGIPPYTEQREHEEIIKEYTKMLYSRIEDIKKGKEYSDEKKLVSETFKNITNTDKGEEQ